MKLNSIVFFKRFVFMLYYLLVLTWKLTPFHCYFARIHVEINIWETSCNERRMAVIYNYIISSSCQLYLFLYILLSFFVFFILGLSRGEIVLFLKWLAWTPTWKLRPTSYLHILILIFIFFIKLLFNLHNHSIDRSGLVNIVIFKVRLYTERKMS